jgi:hypothetical protein
MLRPAESRLTQSVFGQILGRSEWFSCHRPVLPVMQEKLWLAVKEKCR